MIFVAGSAYAGLVETLGIGAKETAQAKAVAANVDSPFAVFYNPAGLTQIKKPTITAGTLVYDAQVYSENFRLIAAENGAQVGPDGSVIKPIMKGDIINDGWQTGNSTDNDPLVVPSLGYAMPITDKISFGVAAYAPYGLHIESPHDPYENPISFYAWESLYARKAVTPTLAYKVSDKLSVGLGLSLGQSESDAGKTYRYNPFVMKAAADQSTQAQFTQAVAGVTGLNLADNAQAAQAKTIVTEMAAAGIASTDSKNGSFNELQLETTDDFNFSWNLGVMYKPTDKVSLGLTYRSRATGDFEGDVIFKGTKVGSVTMDYNHPEAIQGGVRYTFSKNFSVEFDLTWTRWSINERQVEKISVTNTDALKGDIVTALMAGVNSSTALTDAQKSALLQGMAGMDLSASGPINIPAEHARDWEDKFQYQLGAEWLVDDKLSLRSGVLFDPTPVPDDTFDQGWPDTDRVTYSIGFGYEINDKWTIDGVFQYIQSTPAREVRDSHELDHGFNSTIIAGIDKLNAEGDPIETTVAMDNNQGALVGAGITVTYKF